MIQDQIRRHNMHIIFRTVQNVQIDKFAYIFMVKRTVAVRDHITVSLHHAVAVGGIQISLIIFLRFIHIPDFQEHQREVSYRLSLDHDRGIFPGSEPLQFSDILVRQIDTAGKRSLSVDDYDLSVIAVVLDGG